MPATAIAAANGDDCVTSDRRRIAAARRRDRRVARHRARARIEPAYTLPGATEFTDDTMIIDPIWVLHTLKHHPQIVDDLIAATTPKRTDDGTKTGRPQPDPRGRGACCTSG